MRRLLCVAVAVLFFVGVAYSQERFMWAVESESLYAMFVKMADGIVYCHSDRSKTTGVVVKKTSTGSWVVTAGHKADKDFPQSSKIDVKANRQRGTKMYTSLEGSIVVPENRGLDLMMFFVKGLKTKYVFKRFRAPGIYEENWVFGFRGGAGKVPGSSGYVTEYFTDQDFVFTTASLWYGCSGAPVVNRQGVTLGLAVRMANQSTDGLFISGSVVKAFIDKVLKERKK